MRIRSVAVRVLAVGLVISCTADLPVGPGGVERSMRDGLSTSDDCAITIAAIDSFALLVTASSLALPDSTFPSGIDSLSDYSAAHRRAFSDDGRQALIEVSGTCGGLCGSGWLVVLERTDDRWQVRGMLMTWVS